MPVSLAEYEIFPDLSLIFNIWLLKNKFVPFISDVNMLYINFFFLSFPENYLPIKPAKSDSLHRNHLHLKKIEGCVFWSDSSDLWMIMKAFFFFLPRPSKRIIKKRSEWV